MAKPNYVSLVVKIDEHNPRLSEMTFLASITLKTNVQNVTQMMALFVDSIINAHIFL